MNNGEQIERKVYLISIFIDGQARKLIGKSLTGVRIDVEIGAVVIDEDADKEAAEITGDWVCWLLDIDEIIERFEFENFTEDEDTSVSLFSSPTPCHKSYQFIQIKKIRLIHAKI